MTTIIRPGDEASERPRFEESPPLRYRPRDLPGLGPATALFVLVYWLLFGILLQDVDLNQPPDWWQSLIETLPLLRLIPTALITAVGNAFSPLVLRHVLIPGFVGWWLANQVAAGFLQNFYNFPTRHMAASFLSRLQHSSQEMARARTTSRPGTRLAGRSRPVVVVTLITLPFALAFMLLLAYSLFAPPSAASRPVFSFLLVLLGGAWAVIVGVYALSFLIGAAPPSGLHLEREALDEMRQQHALLRVGGPGRVIVGNSDVIVTEYNGRLCRVLGPGVQVLRPFEYVRSVLDLRPQEREGEVSGLTRDGVQVKAHITVAFRISSDDRHFHGTDALNQVPADSAQHPTRERPYPYGERAVRAAAYAETVMTDGRVLAWLSLPLLVASAEFHRALEQSRFDALFDPDAEELAAHPALLQQITTGCRRILRRYGIELNALHLGPLQAPEGLMIENLNGWRAYWQKEQHVRETEERAQALAATEMARQEAEMLILRALVEGIQQAQHDGAVNLAQDVVALRLVEALERTAYETQGEIELDQETLAELQLLRQQLALPGNSTAPGAD